MAGDLCLEGRDLEVAGLNGFTEREKMIEMSLRRCRGGSRAL